MIGNMNSRLVIVRFGGIKKVIVLLATLLILAASWVQLSAQKAQAAPLAGNGMYYGVYSVTISGTIYGASAINFTRSGTVVIAQRVTNVTNNGVNPFEVCLTSGDPRITPQVGAIMLATNAACFNYRSQIDLAYTQLNNDGSLTMWPDSRLGAIYNNIFTDSSSILAFPFTATGGGMVVGSPDGGPTLTGRIDINGSATTSRAVRRYVANISGRYIGRGN